jgi:hypothetical protein
MLTRRASLALLLALAPGTAVGVASGTASAAPLCLPNACAHGHVSIPGGGGDSGGGDEPGGGGGDSGPGVGCPTVGGQVVCDPAAATPAADEGEPTINLLYEAQDGLELPTPDIQTAPSPRSYIRITTGLWVADVGEKTAHARAGNGLQDVTVTASDPVVTWHTGDGQTFTCDAPTAGTNCGHVYQKSSASRPGGKYTITATVSYTITWTCTGTQCDSGGGELDEPMTSPVGTVALAVGEVQTQSQPG